MQRKMIKYSNNQLFFEKLIEYKKEVMQKIATFNIIQFRETFNVFLTYYFAYRLFILENDRIVIDEMLTLALSKVLNVKTLKVLIAYPNLTELDAKYIDHAEQQMDTIFLFCNGIINDSFSKYGILPKINEKIYVDRTLI
jgi:hypothetical protein